MIGSNGKEITGIECRHVVFCEPPEHDNRAPDLHVAKLIEHYADGTTEPVLKMIPNFKRPFWVTKKGLQNHQQKKEWELLSNCNMFESTQSQLQYNMAKALGTPWISSNVRRLQRSQYIYGSDILSTAIIKKKYQNKFPNINTRYSVAAFDIETKMIDGSGKIIMATISYKDRIFTAVVESFVSGRINPIEKLHKLLDLYLSEYVTKRNIKWEVKLVSNDVDVVKECFAKAHEWKPDIISIWNMDFDIPTCVEALEAAGIDPKYVFSDPSVPDEYKHYSYKRGPNQKVTASGKITPIKPPARWHTVYCPSSFYILDSMCAYKHIRISEGEEKSYSLDAILEKHLGVRKLKFKEADGLSKADFHIFMQEKYPLEYIIYNVFDCIGLEILDEKTNDLTLSLPMNSGCSDFESFKSQPRRLVDNLHFVCLEKGRVIGTTSDQMKDDIDSKTLGLDGWIVALAPHLMVENSLRLIKENPNQVCTAYAHVGD